MARRGRRQGLRGEHRDGPVARSGKPRLRHRRAHGFSQPERQQPLSAGGLARAGGAVRGHPGRARRRHQAEGKAHGQSRKRSRSRRPKAKPKKKAKPAAKPKPAPKPKPATKPARPAAFVVPGAKPEPFDEIPLTERAKNLSTWLSSHGRPTNENVSHWLYQHAWIVTGAKLGWWHGAQALETLIAVDEEVQRSWGMGKRSERVARAALAEVRKRSK